MKPLLTTLILSFLILPLFTFAQYTPPIQDGVIVGEKNGLVPCEGSFCGTCDVIVLANTGIKWLLTLTFLFFAVLAVRAGVKLITSQGNAGALSDAKQSFTNAFIGLIIMLVAWLIVDTMLRQLLDGGTGNVNGYGPWSQVQCTSQVIPGAAEPGYFEGDPNYHVPAGYLSGAGGQCTVITDTSNPCSEVNLIKYFGSRAAEASEICNMESGGKPIKSTTDICCGTDGSCSGDPSFSGGYFQINILANGSKVPGCNPQIMYKKNGTKSAQGDCVKRINVGGKSICAGWSCEVTNQAMYNTCIQGAINPVVNLAIAQQLFQASGFQPWAVSAGRCGVPY